MNNKTNKMPGGVENYIEMKIIKLRDEKCVCCMCVCEKRYNILVYGGYVNDMTLFNIKSSSRFYVFFFLCTYLK